MNILRTLVIRFSYSILPLLLFSFGLSWSLYMVFGTPQPLEHALKQSGIYSVFTQNTIEEQTTSTILAVNEPGVQTAIQQAFPPSLLEEDANKIIDGTYDWVQGRTATPHFTVDLTEPRAQLADRIATYVAQKTAALPQCSTQASLQLAQAGTTNLNPYTLTCRPAGVSSDQLASQARQEVLSSDIFSTPVLTADSIKNDKGESLSEQLKAVPQAYTWMIYTLYGTGIVAVLAIVLIVYLQRHQWRRAVKRLSTILISIGVLSAAMAWLVSFALDKTSSILAEESTNQALQTKLIAIITELAHTLQRWWIGYGVTLILLGIIGFVVRKLIKGPASSVDEHQSLHTELSAGEPPKPLDPPTNTGLLQ